MLAEWSRSASAGEFGGVLTGLAVIGGKMLIEAFRALSRARFMEDTPRSAIRAAAQGYVELEGHARLMPGPEIVSPLSGTPCVWWSYRIEENGGEDDDGRSLSSVIDSGQSDDLFLIVDGGGACIVDPVGAVVHPSLSRSWRGDTARPGIIPKESPIFSTGPYSYREQLIRRGDFLYATGWFRSQGGAHDFDERRDVGELLAEWKRDRQELLRRFDTDGNGDIDLQEWQAARAAALEEVRARHLAEAAHPDLDVLCQPPDRRPFTLSTQPRTAVVRSQRIDVWLWLMAAAAIAAVIVRALYWRGAV